MVRINHKSSAFEELPRHFEVFRLDVEVNEKIYQIGGQELLGFVVCCLKFELEGFKDLIKDDLGLLHLTGTNMNSTCVDHLSDFLRDCLIVSQACRQVLKLDTSINIEVCGLENIKCLLILAKHRICLSKVLAYRVPNYKSGYIFTYLVFWLGERFLRM